MALGDKYSTGLPRSVEQEAKWHLGSPPFPGSLTIFAFSSSGSVAKARAFLGSAELAREMERAGVTEKPEIYIAEELASGKP